MKKGVFYKAVISHGCLGAVKTEGSIVGDVGVSKERHWYATHIPTGRFLVGGFSTKKGCVQAAQALLAEDSAKRVIAAMLETADHKAFVKSRDEQEGGQK